jgi:hypothetical protein
MPTLYWGPWLAKICRGGPELQKFQLGLKLDIQIKYFSINYKDSS